MNQNPTDKARANLHARGAGFALARELAESERVALHEAIRAAVAAGLTESECARLSGVTRMTVRAALGKGRRVP